METIPLEILRTAFAQSVIATMATQMSCYLRLVTHPDVLIVDLLDALSRNAVIGDDAATRLHRRFQRNQVNVAPIAQRAYWEQVFRDQGIDPLMHFYPPQAAAIPAGQTIEAKA